MKTLHPTMLILCALLAVPSTKAGKEVDRLLSDYGKIETVTCQIRRTKEGELGKMKFLSRVYWTSKDQLHSEGIAPLKRRTIVDGKSLWQYVNGDPKGFSRPIADLSEQMLISLRMVPGTAMDHLLRLKDLEETVLPSGNASEKRIGLQADNQYVVMALDDKIRLASLKFYKTADMKEPTAQYTYSDFKEVLPGLWVPLTHEAEVHNDNIQFKEIVKVDRFIINEPIAEALFIPSSFFDKNIDFVDEFAKIFPE